MNYAEAVKFENYMNEKSAVANAGLFVSAVLDTEPKMRKTNNPYFGVVRKLQKISGGAGYEYEKSVNNRLVKEGKTADFTAQKMTGRHHVSRCIVVSDSDPSQFYFQFMFYKDNFQKWSTYIDTRTGKEIPADVLKPFLQLSAKPENQGLDNPIMTITVKLENVKELNCGEWQKEKKA